MSWTDRQLQDFAACSPEEVIAVSAYYARDRTVAACLERAKADSDDGNAIADLIIATTRAIKREQESS